MRQINVGLPGTGGSKCYGETQSWGWGACMCAECKGGGGQQDCPWMRRRRKGKVVPGRKNREHRSHDTGMFLCWRENKKASEAPGEQTGQQWEMVWKGFGFKLEWDGATGSDITPTQTAVLRMDYRGTSQEAISTVQRRDDGVNRVQAGQVMRWLDLGTFWR